MVDKRTWKCPVPGCPVTIKAVKAPRCTRHQRIVMVPK